MYYNVMEHYIAPLQGVYAEALLVLAYNYDVR